jgi:hypothetical protein
MESTLKEKLWDYIVHNNPDVMFNLQEKYGVSKYLEEKVSGVMPMAEELLAGKMPLYNVTEVCLSAMTEELKPSRYLYIKAVVEQEFPSDYERLKESGVLTYEVVNLIEKCDEVFDTFAFSVENEENRHLRYAIIGQVHDYLL